MQEQEGIIGILDHRARQTINKRVKQPIRGAVPRDELLEDVSHDNEKIRRQGVALAQPLLAVEPTSRHTVEEDGGATRLQNSTYPATP
jgi:hypothetical protein